MICAAQLGMKQQDMRGGGEEILGRSRLAPLLFYPEYDIPLRCLILFSPYDSEGPKEGEQKRHLKLERGREVDVWQSVSLRGGMGERPTWEDRRSHCCCLSSSSNQHNQDLIYFSSALSFTLSLSLLMLGLNGARTH